MYGTSTLIKEGCTQLTFALMLDANVETPVSPGGKKSVIQARTPTFKSHIQLPWKYNIRCTHAELSKIESKKSEQDGKIKGSKHCSWVINIYIHYSSYTSLLSFLKAPLLDGDPHIQPDRGIRFQVHHPQAPSGCFAVPDGSSRHRCPRNAPWCRTAWRCPPRGEPIARWASRALQGAFDAENVTF